MKKILLMTFVAFLSTISIHETKSFDLTVEHNLIKNGDWRYITQSEFDYAVGKGWLKESDDPMYLVNCTWTDGLGGVLTCNGICRVIYRPNTGNFSIACFNGDSIVGECCIRN
jgi:hypothetical protein